MTCHHFFLEFLTTIYIEHTISLIRKATLARKGTAVIKTGGSLHDHPTDLPAHHIHPLLQSESKERRRHRRKATRNLGATVRRHNRRCGRARGRARGRSGRSSAHGARGIAALAHGEGRVGNEWLLDGLVARAGGVGGKRARLGDTDGLQLGALGGDDDGGGSAAEAEEGGEGFANGGDVVGGDAEGGGGEADLGDEVAELVFVEGHVPGWGLGWG